MWPDNAFIQEQSKRVLEVAHLGGPHLRPKRKDYSVHDGLLSLVGVVYTRVQMELLANERLPSSARLLVRI